MFLITACPRSGTGYTSKLLRTIGIDAGHEYHGKDGIVSWCHIVRPGWLSWIGDLTYHGDYRPIIHQVRNPLDVISSMTTLRQESFLFIFSTTGYPEYHNIAGKDEKFVYACMSAWLQWNEFIEMHNPVLRFRIEDIEAELINILMKINRTGLHKKDIPNISKKTNTRPHETYSWDDLYWVDSELADRVYDKGCEYGY